MGTEKLEKAIVTALVSELGEAGFVPVMVWDGEEYLPVIDAAEVLAAVFAVDQSTVHFAPKDRPEQWGTLGVFLVCGNGEDLISDFHVGRKEFEGAVDRVQARIEHFEVTLPTEVSHA